jgi:hypothetical protein
VDSVVIIWPSGLKETHKGIAVDRYHSWTEGAGK